MPQFQDPAEKGALGAYYRNWRPTLYGRVMNRLWTLLAALGLLPSIISTLVVADSKSGQPVRHVLVPVVFEGKTYLVSMLGEASRWVQDLRAAGGQGVLQSLGPQPVHFDEVPVPARAPILKAWCQIASSARQHLPVAPDAPLAAFAVIAADFPVFQILPRDG